MLSTKQAGEPRGGASSASAPTIALERGRLIARPGPDLYLYLFQTPGGPLPEIGRRGYFLSGENSFPARLADRRGPELSISLRADKPLGPVLGGRFQAGPPAASQAFPELPPEAARPAGADLFLDPREGWPLNAAEAAGAGEARFDPEEWPAAAWAELPGRLSPAGITFIWRQRPDEDSRAARTLVEHFRGRGRRVLVLGDAPADLEPLADQPEAVYIGPAQPGTALHPVSIYTRAAEAAEARETEIAVLRRSLADINRREAGLKAQLSRWDDLDQLAAQFDRLGREAAHYRKHWDEAKRELEATRSGWEEASRHLEGKGGGLLGWLRPGGRSREAAARQEAGCRQSLEEAEKTVAAARREEGGVLAEARRLEGQLADLHRQSESWTDRSALALELGRAREETGLVADLIAAALARPQPSPENFQDQAELLLALRGDLSELAGLNPPLKRFGAVLALASQVRDHSERLALAALALIPEEHLVILGDFTFWPVWNGRPPLLPPERVQDPPERGGLTEKAAPEADEPGLPAWGGLMAAEERDAFKTFLAEGGLFRPAGGPEAVGGPVLARLELGPRTVKKPPRREGDRRESEAKPAAAGLGLRALGDMGPANPVSALMAARAALDFAGERNEPGPSAIILTASPAQSRLIRLMLDDLGAPSGRIFCGEPQDFSHWPQVPLVILEPAFEAPHLSHPWAWPSFGRQRLMWAWQLAADHIWLAGRDAWMSRLPESSPLAALWRLAEARPAKADYALSGGGQPAPSFWEALDKAKNEVWAVLPAFEAYWWRPLEGHFLSAARRRVRVTLLSAPPADGIDREYAAAAIRTLSAYGCTVHLAAGFPGFLATVDACHLSWGHFLEGGQGAHIWSGLKSAQLPRAVPVLGEIMQVELINKKMGRRGGGLKNCRRCGWPLLLINQEQVRGFSDEQALKIGCLNNCQGSKNTRRLDEREPFPAPPQCGLDRKSAYQRIWRGRQEVWVCPRHPDSEHCPSYRVLPGDAEEGADAK